jgi:hypothetical protein
VQLRSPWRIDKHELNGATFLYRRLALPNTIMTVDVLHNKREVDTASHLLFVLKHLAFHAVDERINVQPKPRVHDLYDRDWKIWSYLQSSDDPASGGADRVVSSWENRIGLDPSARHWVLASEDLLKEAKGICVLVRATIELRLVTPVGVGFLEPEVELSQHGNVF